MALREVFLVAVAAQEIVAHAEAVQEVLARAVPLQELVACVTAVQEVLARSVAEWWVDGAPGGRGEAGGAISTSADRGARVYVRCVPRCFHGSVARPLASLMRQGELSGQRRGALRAHRRCRSQKRVVSSKTFIQTGTKYGTKSDRPACCRARNGQPQLRSVVERGTGILFGRWAEFIGAAAAFWPWPRGKV